ncbi:MAG: hypothetical protein ABH879_10970 [archaeon]
MALSRRGFVKEIGILALGALTAYSIPAGHALGGKKKRFPRRTGRGRALIVNGDSFEFTHMENLLRAEKFLLGIGYGTDDVTTVSAPYEAFPRSNVEMIRGVAEYQGVPVPKISGPATSRNIDACLDDILEGVSSDQEIFVYITGHGWAKNGSSYAALNRRSSSSEFDKLTDLHLREVLEKGRYGNAVVLFDGCSGEGFSSNIGGGRITAIAKNRFGQESWCGYFAEFFFNAPWDGRGGPRADLDGDGVVHLAEAARYADRTIRDGGAESDLIIAGDYNPPLVPVQEAEELRPSTFRLFLPNSPVQMSYAPPIDRILAMDNVVRVQGEEQAREALSNPDCSFYLHNDGCHWCSVAEPFVEEILERSDAGRPTQYVLSTEIDRETGTAKPSPETDAIVNHFGLEYAWPQFVRVEGGKMKRHCDGVPVGPLSYGTLPDRTIDVIDRKALRECLL